jgi:hypothetical protein
MILLITPIGSKGFRNMLMNIRPTLFMKVCVILLLSACSSAEVYSSEPLPESTIFVAEGIDNAIIQFIWLELPAQIEPGSADVRLFLAKTEPPEPSIPNPTNLRCLLTTEDESAILGPERVPFEFMEDGTFWGSYTFRACPECIECYMNFDYTLEITGAIAEETVTLDIAVKHIGLNVPGSFVSAELALAGDTSHEPRITCNQALECAQIVFADKD